MHTYITRVCATVAVGVALSTVGVAVASASGTGSGAFLAVRVASAVTSQAAPSPGTQLWLKHYHQSAVLLGDIAYSMAVSPDGGTVFVTGEGSDSDYATVAYNATTGAQLWAKTYNGPSGLGDIAYSVAVSPTGKTVFVTGRADNKTDGDDYATIAYNAATGARLWVKLYVAPGARGDVADSVTVSPAGTTVFVTGYTFTPSGNPTYATIAYDAATGAQLWAKSYALAGRTNEADSVAVSPTGKTVFVTGTSGGATLGDAEYATIAYNAATGAQLWAKLYKSPNGATAYQLAVSPTGNAVFVTGGNGFSYGTVAYNAATGAQLWVKGYTSPGATARSVAVSPTGKTVFVTGYADKASGSDYATVAYNAATGAQLWATHYNGALQNQAKSVAVSPTGAKVYVTGISYGSSTAAYATVAYNATTGAQLWATRHSSSDTDITGATSVAVSPANGTVFVTGQGQANGFFGDYVTIAYQG